MSRQPSAPDGREAAKRDASPAITRAHLLDVEVDRPKRIDQYLDYFGSGGEGRPSPEDGAAGAFPGAR